MKACSGVELRHRLFLNSALDRGEWSALCSGCCVLRSKNAQCSFNISGGPQNHKQKLNHVRGFRFPPRCEWDLHSSGMLGSLDLVFSYRRFGTTYRLRTAWPFKMGPRVAAETSVNNCSTLRNIPEERRSVPLSWATDFDSFMSCVSLKILTAVPAVRDCKLSRNARHFLCGLFVCLTSTKAQMFFYVCVYVCMYVPLVLAFEQFVRSENKQRLFPQKNNRALSWW